MAFKVIKWSSGKSEYFVNNTGSIINKWTLCRLWTKYVQDADDIVWIVPVWIADYWERIYIAEEDVAVGAEWAFTFIDTNAELEADINQSYIPTETIPAWTLWVSNSDGTEVDNAWWCYEWATALISVKPSYKGDTKIVCKLSAYASSDS